MNVTGTEIVGSKLSSAIPREFLLSLEQLVPSALAAARLLSTHFMEGHRPTASGVARHLLLNEAMIHALDDARIAHPPLRGNAIVFGTVGVVTMARVHMNQSQWDNARRSKTKVRLCKPNAKVKRLVEPDLFEGELPIDCPIEMTALLVTEGDGKNGRAPIHVVVTDDDMDLRNPVFREELHVFLQRYQKSMDIVDNVKPKLKGNVKKIFPKTDNSDDSPESTPA